MAAKKTSFYHTRNRIVPNKALAAEVLGVTVSDVERMDIEGAPIAERFLRLWDRKYVGVPGWDGWLFSRGVLMFKGQQWRPDCLLLSRREIEVSFKREVELKGLYSVSGLVKILRYLIFDDQSKRF